MENSINNLRIGDQSSQVAHAIDVDEIAQHSQSGQRRDLDASEATQHPHIQQLGETMRRRLLPTASRQVARQTITNQTSTAPGQNDVVHHRQVSPALLDALPLEMIEQIALRMPITDLIRFSSTNTNLGVALLSVRCQRAKEEATNYNGTVDADANHLREIFSLITSLPSDRRLVPLNALSEKLQQLYDQANAPNTSHISTVIQDLPAHMVVHLPGSLLLASLVRDVSGNKGLRFFNKRILMRSDWSDTELDNLNARLFPVAIELFLNRDRDLEGKISDLAAHASCNTKDRTNYFLGNIELVAKLSRIMREESDSAKLWKHGLSFFKLDTLRSILQPRVWSDHEPNQYLHVEYALQEILDLPIRYAPPIGQFQGIERDQLIEEMRLGVNARTAEDNSEHVIEFMRNWEPWVEHVKRMPQYKGKFKELDASLHLRLEMAQEERAIQDGPFSNFSDLMFELFVMEIEERSRHWEHELIMTATREFAQSNSVS